MAQLPPVAYGTDGIHLVTADGPLVLVHDGESEGPLYTHQMQSTVVALSAKAGRVVAFDESGRIDVLEDKGTVTKSYDLGAAATAGAASTMRVAVVGPDKSALFRGEVRVDLEVSGGSCVAFSNDGARLAVGTTEGSLHVFDAISGKRVSTAELPGPAYGLAFSKRHDFVVTTTGGLGKLSPDGTKVTPLCGTGEFGVGAVAVSEDGLFAAARVDDGRVILFQVAANRPVGMITYERETGGVAFGPKGWLAVALDKGDGNKINLDTGAVHRTDPHPGRPRNSWVLAADVQTDRVAEARGGGASSRPPPPAAPVPFYDQPIAGPSGATRYVLVALAGFVIFLLIRLVLR
jgi:WD40 repeat protein